MALGVEHGHRARLQGQQAFRRRTRLAACPAVEIAADQQEEQQGDAGVEVDILAAAHSLIEADAGGQDDGQGDRHVHVEAAVAKRLQGRGEERLAGVGNGRQRDHRRDPMEQAARARFHVGGEAGPDRDRQHHDIHGGEAGDAQRTEQAPPLPVGLDQARVERPRDIARLGQSSDQGFAGKDTALTGNPDALCG